MLAQTSVLTEVLHAIVVIGPPMLAAAILLGLFVYCLVLDRGKARACEPGNSDDAAKPVRPSRPTNASLPVSFLHRDSRGED